MATIECERCGYLWEINAIRKRVNLCVSCRARKVQTVHTGQGKCIPWHGYFARDEMTPVDDDGKPVLPGERSCGRKDCVAPGHVRPSVGGDD